MANVNDLAASEGKYHLKCKMIKPELKGQSQIGKIIKPLLKGRSQKAKVIKLELKDYSQKAKTIKPELKGQSQNAKNVSSPFPKGKNCKPRTQKLQG